jgi:hypothetical protein
VSGSKGVMDLPLSVYKEGWHAAASACLASCVACPRCAHISLSLNHRDCSWFDESSCQLLKDEAVPTPAFYTPGTPSVGFRSGRFPTGRRGLSRGAVIGGGAAAVAVAPPPASRKLILVTTTYPHAQQVLKLEHCLRRISSAPIGKWIVGEDTNATTPAVAALLARSGVPYVHFALGPSRAKGHVQRGRAYEIIRDQKLEGVVYNLDDDNEYDPRLWDELRRLQPRRVGVVSVQLEDASKDARRRRRKPSERWIDERRVERPIYDRATGAFGGFAAGWCYGDGQLSQLYGPRRFCIDMGGFAFDASLIHSKTDAPPWSFAGSIDRTKSSDKPGTWRGGESEFLLSLISFPEQLQPLANCGLDVLVYHNGYEDEAQSVQRPFVGLRQSPHPTCKLDGW